MVFILDRKNIEEYSRVCKIIFNLDWKHRLVNTKGKSSWVFLKKEEADVVLIHFSKQVYVSKISKYFSRCIEKSEKVLALTSPIRFM